MSANYFLVFDDALTTNQVVVAMHPLPMSDMRMELWTLIIEIDNRQQTLLKKYNK